MKRLIVLCLGLLALVDASQSPIQQQAVDLLLDFFHSRNLVRSVFKEQAVTDVIEEVLNMGTFVQLQVELAQTHCRKQQRRTHSCHIKAGGRRQTCLACIKFGSTDPESVLDRSLHCLSDQSPVFQTGRHVEQATP
ncbi:retinoic acid receptor responder protein 2 isoform X2 [Elgaria multicarinata webbii]|uniref:retinoic acid receptor responder protein 2 isoform X2 n=1 Tax=Elgaria multicarinata webbii TaxID=159646 RepID=UPI002FCD179B